MEHDRSRRFRLGLFALGAAGLFVALLAFILQSSFDGDRSSYYIVFQDNVKGMVVGSKVNFQGVPIGVVSDMRFQQGKTLVELRVDPSRAEIQDVTRARMDRLLVTGQVTVELEGFSGEGRPIPPGSFIEPKEDPLNSLMKTSLPEVVAQASRVLARLEAVLGNTEKLLGDGNRGRVEQLLDSGERAASEFAERTLPELHALMADARRTVAASQGTAEAATVALESVAASVASLQSLQGPATALLREAAAVVGGVRGPALATFAGLRSALDDLRGLLRQLKLAPDSLLFGVRPAAARPPR
ncbi:MAG: MlaD family protein [Planctomycetota bacterium]